MRYIKPSLDGKKVDSDWVVGCNKLFPLDGTKVATNPDHEMLVSRGYLLEVQPEIEQGFERGDLEVGIETATYKVVASEKNRAFITSQITRTKNYYINQITGWRTGADLAIPGSLTEAAANFGLQILTKHDALMTALESTPDEELVGFDYITIWDDVTDFDQPLAITVSGWRSYMDSISWNKKI